MTPPGHPERPERAAVFNAVADARRRQGGEVREPRPATRDELARVHTTEYLDLIERTAGRSSMLDADTFTSPESYEVALLAAGAAVQAAEHALDTRDAAFALVRPPGHHAERDRAMGFCFYNNVAVAAASAIARGTSRVAVIDIDVHHGNGTQWSFYDDASVLYISSHQYPFYPGTGAASDVGHGDGQGFTVNIPLPAGSTDADYVLVYRALVVPILEQFAPELTLISAGFDAHEADPLAAMRMSAAGYAELVSMLKSSAVRSGVVAAVTEGGYDLPALRECLNAALTVLDGKDPGLTAADFGTSTARGLEAVERVRSAQRPFWAGL